jgi:thiamine-phosphate pyrophosphorylase
VNERADVALSCGADGVHLPSGCLPPSAMRGWAGPACIIGLSCHSEDDVELAIAEGVDYVLLGPVFPTPSKPGAPALGLSRFGGICKRSKIPIFALGGIALENAASCVSAGAGGVAGIRLFQQAHDLEALCRYIRTL